MAKDKDEIPNFDHLNLDGLEPAAVPPEIPAEESTQAGAAPAGEKAEVPGDLPPEAPSGEPVADLPGDFGIQADAAGEAPDAVEEPGEIEFGVSGEAGEELKTEEEHEPEQSEEQLADAAAARKLNIAALVLMAVGGLGVLAGFVVAFLKEGVATWLAVLIGIHYAAPPALLLALGLFLFFAVKKSGGTATLDSIKQGRVYEAVLAVAFLALWIAGYCLLGELSRYGYDLKATKVDRGTPTAVVYAGPPSTTATD